MSVTSFGCGGRLARSGSSVVRRYASMAVNVLLCRGSTKRLAIAGRIGRHIVGDATWVISVAISCRSDGSIESEVFGVILMGSTYCGAVVG